MPPAVAERNPVQRQPRRPDRSQFLQQYREYRWRLKPPIVGQHGKTVIQTSRPRRIQASKDIRFRGYRPAKAAQQVNSAVDADQRIGVRNLHAAYEVGNGYIRKHVGISSKGLSRIRREYAAGKHRKASQSQSLRTAHGRSGHGIVVTPRRACAGVEEDADHGQIEFGAGPCGGIVPYDLVGQGRPTINTIHRKVPPARMKRYRQRGIRLARGLHH